MFVDRKTNTRTAPPFASCILVGLITVCLIYGIFVQNILLDNGLINKTIDKNEIEIYFYKEWGSIIANDLSGDKNEKLSAVMLQTFAETFDETWLKSTLKATLNDIQDLMSAKEDNLDFTLNLKDKKSVYVQKLETAFLQYSDSNLESWHIDPSNIARDARFISENRLKIPDYLNLNELIGEDLISQVSSGSKKFNKLLKNTLYFSILLSLLIFITEILLLKRKEALRFFGISILSGSVISMNIFFLIKIVVQGYVHRMLNPIMSFIYPLFKYFYNLIAVRFFIISFICALIGILLIAIGSYISKTFKKSGIENSGKPKIRYPVIFLTFALLVLSSIACENGKTMKIYSQRGEDMENFGKIRLLSVNVTPHVFSGKIPSYKRKDPFSVPQNPGALVKIFVFNADDENEFDGRVLFNGKSGQELLDENQVSWCSVPDTRRGGFLSSKIPPGGLDVYTLNITDPEFYRNGILLEFIYPGKETSVKIKTEVAEYPVYFERVLFSSSLKESSMPDEMIIWIKNNSDAKVTLSEPSFYTAKPYFSMHWWDRKIRPDIIETGIQNMTLAPGERNYIKFSIGEIPYGESIFEIDVEIEGRTEKLMYHIKPFKTSFDINSGWSGRDLASSELFAKTLAMMHFNTAHGDLHGYNNTPAGLKYPMKGFGVYDNTEVMNRPENIKNIHGVEFLGEPQMDNKNPQEIFYKMSRYRTSGYPTTLTLTHEPGYYKYAGLVDFPHFDAYRVIAPHADKWGEYTDFGEKNTLWGAPLETAGIYMRSLHEISRPNPVAAWTQGVAGGWFSIWRITSPNPNPTEIRLQAYQKVANGALSLYWFNISGTSVLRSRYALDEIRNINREFLTVENLLTESLPYSWENKFMDLDLNVLSGPDYAILFVSDLTYKVSQVNEFVISSARDEVFEFSLPKHINSVDMLLKVTKDGVFKLNADFSENVVSFSDSIFKTGMYVAYSSSQNDYYKILVEKYDYLIDREKSTEFDPINNDDDFLKLKEQIKQ